jgi:hypothetical protein
VVLRIDEGVSRKRSWQYITAIWSQEIVDEEVVTEEVVRRN